MRQMRQRTTNVLAAGYATSVILAYHCLVTMRSKYNDVCCLTAHKRSD